MRKTSICWFAFLMIIGCMVAAQQPAPQSNPPCGGRSAKALVDWPQFRFDLCHTGYKPNEFLLSPTTVGNLVLDWKYGAQELETSPAVVDGIVYVGGWDGVVHALKADTGAPLCEHAGMSEMLISSPAVANDVVYLGSLNGILYALKASTGTLLWKYATRDMVVSSPAVANGVVYVGSFC